MKTTRKLYRCHGEFSKENAELSAKVIKGYFDLFNKKVQIKVEPMDRSHLEGLAVMDTPCPYDVKIVTANDVTEKIAHAVGWAYLEGKNDHKM